MALKRSRPTEAKDEFFGPKGLTKGDNPLRSSDGPFTVKSKSIMFNAEEFKHSNKSDNLMNEQLKGRTNGGKK